MNRRDHGAGLDFGLSIEMGVNRAETRRRGCSYLHDKDHPCLVADRAVSGGTIERFGAEAMKVEALKVEAYRPVLDPERLSCILMKFAERF